MPTFSSISLDRLLEPIKKNININLTMPTVTTTTTTTTEEDHRPILISDSSFSFPPSEGVRRNGGSDSSSSSFSFPAEAVGRNWGSGNGRDAVVRVYEKSGNGCQNGRIGGTRLDGKGESSPRLVPSSPDTGDFFEPQESLSVGSSVEAEGSVGGDRSFRWSVPAAAEFYDAYEELSEGGSQSQNYLCDLEAELREKRLNWLMEMEGRKQAEEALETMKRQWERLAQKLSQEGLSLPSASAVAATDDKLEVDPAEDLCEQIRLARVVSTFVGSAVGNAVVEKELESKIESKNFEISRLLQRLKYYEAINHEMSQKNQEAIDVERRLKRKQKRRRQRWMWGMVGASVVLGSAALAWTFLHAASGSDSNDSYNTNEGDSLEAD